MNANIDICLLILWQNLGWQTVNDLILNETLKMVSSVQMTKIPSILHACLTTDQKPVPGNFEAP